jgi:hypothetical protein
MFSSLGSIEVDFGTPLSTHLNSEIAKVDFRTWITWKAQQAIAHNAYIEEGDCQASE